MEGFAHRDFASVEETFAGQLERTDGGAAVTIFHHGEPVVDLWGGLRTREGDPWESDTFAMCFSTTKGVASAALHLQAEAGLVDYDERVATYWPEFAQNGKENITVRHVLSHSAGLHRLRSVIDSAHHMLDWDHMVAAIAAEPPAYEPGTQCGYHALTYGWLVGEIVRRVTGRPLADVITRRRRRTARPRTASTSGAPRAAPPSGSARPDAGLRPASAHVRSTGSGEGSRISSARPSA